MNDARRAGDKRPSVDAAIALRRQISGMLLRGIVLVVLTASGLLLAYGAYNMSPYTQASLPMLSRAIIGHGILAAVYAWNVRTGSRYIPLAVAALAGIFLLVYLWQVTR